MAEHVSSVRTSSAPLAHHGPLFLGSADVAIFYVDHNATRIVGEARLEQAWAIVAREATKLALVAPHEFLGPSRVHALRGDDGAWNAERLCDAKRRPRLRRANLVGHRLDVVPERSKHRAH